MNALMVVAWLPVFFIARNLITNVIEGNPSSDLLNSAYLAVVGTLAIITSVYLFGLVLFNKFATQNIGGVHARVIKPMLVSAILLYAVVGFVILAC